ncbi:MAG: gliding motility-associated C-terminal domain-containing protein [Sporocytophaga sp.]|nr:gliding motility-associated C-terminal domain-containing protein [Sporocytophaga sp.]
MKKIYFLFFILFLSSQLFASHIVGGEFQLRHYRGYTYTLSMRLYFDKLHAAAGLLDADIVIKTNIFRKSDNVMVGTQELVRNIDYTTVKYATEECDFLERGVQETLNLKYKANIFLDPDIYDDPGGYYIVWERCCRNGVIENIREPDKAGQVFYLEFPPVKRAGRPFVNSSPVFEDMVADYFCRNQMNTFNFGGYDPDGDSLVYTLVTPLNGHASIYGEALPDPKPAPYDPVVWRTGYSASNMIRGNPALQVNPRNGILSVNPNEANNTLFVVSMIVDEYRNNRKIGQVRRDYQFLVKNCPVNLGPKVDIEKPKGPDTEFKGDTFVVKLNEIKSFELLLSDSSTTVLNRPANIHISKISTNLPSSIFTPPGPQQLRPGVNDTVRAPFVFNPCDKLLIEEEKLFDLDIVVSDDGCPHPRTDTLKIKVLIIPPPENPAPILQFAPGGKIIDVYPGSVNRINAIGLDSADFMYLSATGLDFNMEEKGMFFTNINGKDSIANPLLWMPDCGALDPGVFNVVFKLKDSSCVHSHQVYDTLTLRVKDSETQVDKAEPKNLITPNGDGKNDTYIIDGLHGGNCEYHFRGIEIYNRWGSRVFKSENPGFSWDPEGYPDGIYYYIVDLNKKKIKGWVEIMR